MKQIGLSVIIRSEHEFNIIKSLIGNENLYISFAPQMLEILTSIVIFSDYESDFSVGSVGCAEFQKNQGIRTVEFKKYFKS